MRNFWRPLVVLAVLFAASLPFFARASADGLCGQLTPSSGKPGSSVQMLLSYDGSWGDISALLVEIPSSTDWKVTDSKFLQEGYIFDYSGEGVSRWLFTQRDGKGLSAGDVLTVDLRLSSEAASGSVELRVDVKQIMLASGMEQENRVLRLPYQVSPQASSEASLLALKPSQGTLSPAFSPEVTEYQVTVPFPVTSMSYELQASKGAKYSINRKNLGAGGSDTRFEITVTAEDGKTKRVYAVTVHREEKPPPLPTASPTPRPIPTPRPTATPKPTKTPKPTATPKATNTPKPTATPKPTKTPKPTATPKPTKTPKPSATPKSTRTPKPSSTPVPAMSSSGPTLPPSGVQVVTRPILMDSGRDAGWKVSGVTMGGIVMVLLSGPVVKFLKRFFSTNGNGAAGMGKENGPDEK